MCKVGLKAANVVYIESAETLWHIYGEVMTAWFSALFVYLSFLLFSY